MTTTLEPATEMNSGGYYCLEGRMSLEWWKQVFGHPVDLQDKVTSALVSGEVAFCTCSVLSSGGCNNNQKLCYIQHIVVSKLSSTTVA